MSAGVAEDRFLVGLEQFQGPLDLLLHLIRTQDLDIFDIPIARITEQFLAAIADLERMDLERAGEFLEMAATLVRIKAQMLFPRRGEDEDDDPRADLVRRLLEYEHYGDAARRLEEAQRERARLHAKGYVPPRPVSRIAEVPLQIEWDEVWSALQELAARTLSPEPPAGYRVNARLVRVEDQMEYVVNRLQATRRLEFGALVAPWRTRLHSVVSLLACLELARLRTITLRQKAPFDALWVVRESGDAA